jgi:hypothetical protein
MRNSNEWKDGDKSDESGPFCSAKREETEVKHTDTTSFVAENARFRIPADSDGFLISNYMQFYP